MGITDKQNKIIQGDCLEVMKTMPDNCIDLVVTSPPYNVGIKYQNTNDEKEWAEYGLQMLKTLKEMFRIIRDGGRVCWNIPSFSSRQNLYEIFLNLFRLNGFLQYAEIIWNKKQISSRTAWGSFQSASEPNILPSHEYILIFYKGSKNHGKGQNDITKEEFIKWTDGMWEFTPETNSKHPAPYPETLAKRCIKMFSYVGETILDPFVGSGTTARACKDLRRNYIGIDISKEYVDMSNQRLAQEVLL
jgi:site-specific DNA-methyltransferase (adenine-specific)